MVAILPALATGALSAAGGFAASNLLGGLFGGGGSSGGGGGSFDVSGILPESLPFVDQYLEDQFNLAGTDDLSDYFATKPVRRKEGRELASVIGQSMFRGATPTRKQTKDAYKFAKLTGNTGSSNQAQQAISSYFAQTNPEYRMPSSQELLAGMKYGPLVGTDSGVFLFGGTDRTNKMFDRLDDARSYRSQKIQDIYNT
tara:strand:- start:26 stop:622 length:597 start_codon:yes stop_codon:yes gene_type:complete